MNSALSKGIYKNLQAHHFRAINRAMHALKQSTPRTQKKRRQKQNKKSIKLCYNARVSSLQNRPHPYPFHHRSKHREIFTPKQATFPISHLPPPLNRHHRHRHRHLTSHLNQPTNQPTNQPIYLPIPFPSLPFPTIPSFTPTWLSS